MKDKIWVCMECGEHSERKPAGTVETLRAEVAKLENELDALHRWWRRAAVAADQWKSRYYAEIDKRIHENTTGGTLTAEQLRELVIAERDMSSEERLRELGEELIKEYANIAAAEKMRG